MEGQKQMLFEQKSPKKKKNIDYFFMHITDVKIP